MLKSYSLVPSPSHPSFCLAAVEKKPFLHGCETKAGVGMRLKSPIHTSKVCSYSSCGDSVCTASIHSWRE